MCRDYYPEHEKKNDRKYFIFYKIFDEEQMFTKICKSRDEGERFLNANASILRYYEFYETGKLIDCQYYYDGNLKK